MAALAEDRSPLQLGSEGVYKGVHFALIGRIQIRYSQGIWNEWHLLFDDMRTGWLSEAGGEYVISFLRHVDEPLPAFDDMVIGRRMALASQTWTVSNIEKAECIAGQGELPFKVGGGYPVSAVDLRNERFFASLDYSETPPLLFVGEAVEFNALRMNNLRDGMAVPEKKVEAKVFRCPSCGSPLQARSADILAVGCTGCGTVVDAGDKNYRILSAALTGQERCKPRLPLGSKGKLAGKPVEVIGFMVRQCRVDGIPYTWREYLLAAENGTYRWLSEYNGHWNVIDVLSRPPSTNRLLESESLQYQGQRFKHFQTTQVAEVVQVAGEFTWRVSVGETCRIVDYVAPPLLLSRESTNNDLNWSLATYATPEEITQAFALKKPLPDPIGVYANQPNPWQENRRGVWGQLWKLLLVAILLQGIFMLFATEKVLLREDFRFRAGGLQSEVTSRTFELPAKTRKLAVQNLTSLDNNWMSLDMVLVNKRTGENWSASREISFYSGYDDGYWSEGNARDEVIFRNIPAGTYYLAIDPEIGTDRATDVSDQVVVQTTGAGWSNFVFLLIALSVFPLFALFRHAAFETSRWMESDHPPSNSSGDD